MTSRSEDFKTLFESRFKGLEVKEGAVLKGRIVSVTRDYVSVDVGFKSEGMIDIEEFRNFDGAVAVNPGDPVDVVVEQVEDPRGHLILSKERADALHLWDRVQEVYDKGLPIDGVVVNKIKGGMSVNLGGIKAFLPASQIDLKPVKSLDKLINHKFQFKILKLNKAKGNIVLSRRAVLETEREQAKKELLENLHEGQIIKGEVKNITEYGAFVDLGGIDGLLHITDISWGRIGHPTEVLSVGSEIEVVVLRYDRDNEKISLGYKQLKPDPWKEVDKKFSIGDKLQGKVVNIADYGIFVELTEGIEGLVHLSEMSWNKKVKHPSKVVKQGDVIEAVVLDMDPANRRIALGLKQLEPNPWHSLEERYPVGTKVKGTVQNVTDFGIFVGIEGEEIDGLVHVSDLAWDKNFKHPSELYQKGQEVFAIVLSVDKNNERFALGVKQLTGNPWEELRRRYTPGENAKGTITEVGSKGLVVKLSGDAVGYVAASDLPIASKEKVADHYKEGQEIAAKVKKLDEKAGKVLLSIKAYEKAGEKEALQAFHAEQGDSKAKLKDAMK